MEEYTPEERRGWLDSLYGVPAGASLLLERNGQLLVVGWANGTLSSYGEQKVGTD